jgi:hypothetical protein
LRKDFNLGKRKMQSRKLGLFWQVWMKYFAGYESPLLLLFCDYGGQTLHWFSSSVNLYRGFDNSAPYWHWIHLASFW